MRASASFSASSCWARRVGRNSIWSTGLLRRLVNADPASPWLTAAIYPRLGGPAGYDDPFITLYER